MPRYLLEQVSILGHSFNQDGVGETVEGSW